MDIKDVILDVPSSLAAKSATKLLVVESGVLKSQTIAQIRAANSGAGDVSSATGTIDLTGLDSNVVPITDAGTLTDITIDEGDIIWVEFQDNGGTISSSSTISVPGKEKVWAAGDKAEIVGLAGGLSEVRQYVTKSGAASRRGIFHCRAVGGVTDPLTDLNNGDVFGDVTLATNDIVLVYQAVTASDAGIWIVGVTPTRHPLFDTFDSFQNVLIKIDDGAAFLNSVWTCSSPAGGVIDTDALTFEVVVGRIGAQYIAGSEYVQLAKDGLKIHEFGAGSNYVTFKVGTTLSADRQLQLNVPDSDESLTIIGSPTIAETYAQITPVAFADLPGSPAFGMIAAVNDANHHGWGDSITSGGSGDSVIVWYDGADWRVMGGQA